MAGHRFMGGLVILCAAGLGGASLWSTLPEPQSGTQQPGSEPAEQLGKVCWSELVFKASKLLISATATLSYKEMSGAAAAADLHVPPKGKALAAGDKVLLVSMDNDLPFGRFEKVSAWLDPEAGAALQSEKLVSGSKQYWKLRRYTPRGYFMWRSEPKGKREKQLDQPDWSKRSEYPVHWQERPPDGTAVSDSYALLYLISAARLDRAGARMSTIIYSKKQLVELEFKAGRLRSQKVSFTEVSGQQKRTRNGQIRVREVTGSGRPLAGNDNDNDDGKNVDLGFLGMQGELTVLLEEGTGIPIEVRGRADTIGKLRVMLKRVTLAEPGT